MERERERQTERQREEGWERQRQRQRQKGKEILTKAKAAQRSNKRLSRQNSLTTIGHRVSSRISWSCKDEDRGQ